MTDQPYKLSFTAGSLLHKDSVLLAKSLLRIGNWEDTRKQAIANNLLQSRTVSTAIRTIREVGHRLQTLSTPELELLVNGSSDEQAQILWIAICRYYRLIAEFASDVVREKFLSMSYQLEEEDFDFFFNKKAELYDELEETQQVTRNKLKQVVFRMLREAGLISDDRRILPTILSSQIKKLIAYQGRQAFLIFPIFDYQIN